MGRISEKSIEEVAARNDIVEVIGSYFPLKRAGAVFKALCPFHHEKTPSFTVTPSRQMFHCFGCNAGGSVFRFVMMYENVDFPTAIRRLAERAGVILEEDTLSPADDRRLQLRKRLLALHAQAADWFHQNLLRSPDAAPARRYLQSRGFTSAIAKNWTIGYAPNAWDRLLAFAKSAGFTFEEIVRSGLVKAPDFEDASLADPAANLRRITNAYDRFRHRVMFPIHDDRGQVIAFSGRVLDPDAKEAKYVNSPETMLFTKGNVLFGLDKSKRAIMDKGRAIVCEGQLDLISAFEHGIQNVIAPQGTAFTERQASLLRRFTEEVILCFDADVAGQKAAERSLPALMDVGIFVRVATMPDGHDPDSLIREQGGEAFQNRIDAAKDFFDFQIDRAMESPDARTPRGRTALARKLCAFVGHAKDPVMRDALVLKIAGRLELQEKDLRRLLKATPSGTGPEPATPNPAAPSDPTLVMLCQVALQDPGAKEWLMEHDWDALLRDEPDGPILANILGGAFDATSPSSLAAFLASLSTDEEAALSRLASAKPLPNPLQIARDCWAEIEQRSWKRRIEAIKTRLRTEGSAIPIAEASKLQKEVLDLQRRLSHISRPFSRHNR